MTTNLNVHLLTFTPSLSNIQYSLTVEAFNSYGSNSYDISLAKYAHATTYVIQNYVVDLTYSNQPHVINLYNIFTGYELEFKILSNPFNNLNLNTNILSIDNRYIYNTSNYIVEIRSSNTYGEVDLTINITHNELNKPTYRDILNYNLSLSDQPFEIIIENIFYGLIETINIHPNPFGNARLYDCNTSNIVSITTYDSDSSNTYTITIGASNVFGSNEYVIYVIDYKHIAPEHTDISY